jgi:hypothetical protein
MTTIANLLLISAF